MKTRSQVHREREEKAASARRDFAIDVPNDVMNEQVIVTAMLVDDEARRSVLKVAPPDAFYAAPHKVIVAALAELERRGLEYDPATLTRLAPDVDAKILERYPAHRPGVPLNLDFHLDTLLWDWKRAQATAGPLAEFIGALQDPLEERSRVAALARQVSGAFEGEHGPARYLRDPREVVRQSMEALRARVDGQAHYPFGIDGLDYWGADDVDRDGRALAGTPRLTPGTSPGTISMITGLSGGGKSTLTGHATLGIARTKMTGGRRRRVLFGAWEEEAPVTIELLACLSLKWSRSHLLNGRSNTLRGDDGRMVKMTPEEIVLFEEREHAIAKSVTFFDNPFQRNIGGRRATNEAHLDVVQEHIAHTGCDVFIADLWQRCLVETRPEDERQALYRQLAIASEQRCHVLIVHQQRAKDIELRPDKRPTREGIIGSGAWLDVCATVLAPHLPSKWKPVKAGQDVMEVYVLKQRHGAWPLGVSLDWDPDSGQISGGSSFAVTATTESSTDAKVPDGAVAMGRPQKPRRRMF